jgi:hypothetical protein
VSEVEALTVGGRARQKVARAGEMRAVDEQYLISEVESVTEIALVRLR